MIIGYARVSKIEQSFDRQIDALVAAGVDKRNIYKEKITGTKSERPALQKMLDELQNGDTIIVSELTRLSRSTKDLFKLVEIIESKGANIKSLKEHWIDTTTAQGKLLFTVFAGVSQFERDIISQRTKESLASSRARGRYGGRPSKTSTDIDLALKMYDSMEYSISEISKATGLSKTTLYRYVKKRAKRQ